MDLLMSGETDLPPELVMLVFEHLSGNDLRTARLVCRQWEAASRPFFASKHLSRTIFWLTSSRLDELQQLSRKFGPYMRTIYITTDHFTLSGFYRMLKQHWYDKHRTFKRSRFNSELQKMVHTTFTALDVKTNYLTRYFKNLQWSRYGVHDGNAKFFWRYICNIFSQSWLKISGRDVSKLAAVLESMPRCEAKVASVDYDIGSLQANNRRYGKPAPQHAFHLALYSWERGGGIDEGYSAHVERVVKQASRRQKIALDSKLAGC